jgi:hypothetical protein
VGFTHSLGYVCKARVATVRRVVTWVISRDIFCLNKDCDARALAPIGNENGLIISSHTEPSPQGKRAKWKRFFVKKKK